jgi:hypothetical protein
MADYTITTSAEEELSVTMARLSVNEAGAKDPTFDPFKDNAAFVAFFARTNILAPLVAKFIEARVQANADSYRATTPDKRAIVDAALSANVR